MTTPDRAPRPTELPPASARQHLHRRTITMDGYRRDDGLFDIEGELHDSKSLRWPTWDRGVQPPSQPVHLMRVRLTLDDSYGVRAVAAALPAVPFDECSGTLPPLDGLVGATVARGWRKAIDAALGGPVGCTHVRELLMAMGTAAYQTLEGERQRAIYEALPQPAGNLPTPTAPMRHWGQCVAWRHDGTVLLRVAPAFSIAPKQADDAG